MSCRHYRCIIIRRKVGNCFYVSKNWQCKKIYLWHFYPASAIEASVMYRSTISFRQSHLKKWQFLLPEKFISILLQSFLCVIERKQLACYCMCVLQHAFYYQNLFFTQIYSEAFFHSNLFRGSKTCFNNKAWGMLDKMSLFNLSTYILFLQIVYSMYDLDLIMRKYISTVSL